jgi:hypothetical protein
MGTKTFRNWFDLDRILNLKRNINGKPDEIDVVLGTAAPKKCGTYGREHQLQKPVLLITKYPIMASGSPEEFAKALEAARTGPVLVKFVPRNLRKGYVSKPVGRMSLHLLRYSMVDWTRRRDRAKQKREAAKATTVTARIADVYDIRAIFRTISRFLHYQSEKQARKGMPHKIINFEVKFVHADGLKVDLAKDVVALVRWCKRKYGAKKTRKVVRSAGNWTYNTRVKGVYKRLSKPMQVSVTVDEIRARYEKNRVRRPDKDFVLARSMYDLIMWASNKPK